MLPEIVIMFAATVVYAFASAALVIAVVFGKARVEKWGVYLAATGFALQAVSIVFRWMRIGRGPTLGFYEIASLLSFIGVGLFLFLVYKYRGFAIAGAAILPFSLLILGGSLLASKGADAVTGSLASGWLVIHVLFANLAYGCYAAAFVLSAAFLMREKAIATPRQPGFAALLERFPAQEIVDDLTFKFVGAGFLFQGVMIASGAIWANEAWGRYWGWDPMETWSLIAWAIYAIYLHLRLTMGWKGRRAAWVAIVSLPIIVFSLLGVPIAYKSIHGAYLKW